MENEEIVEIYRDRENKVRGRIVKARYTANYIRKEALRAELSALKLDRRAVKERIKILLSRLEKYDIAIDELGMELEISKEEENVQA